MKNLESHTTHLETAAEGEFRMVPHYKLKPYERQPRTFFSEKDIAELADSIEDKEQFTPIIATLIPSDDLFTIVGGERRWRACCVLAQRHSTDFLVKTVVVPYRGEQWLFRSAFMDNLYRADMHPLDIAAAFKRLREFDEPLEEIAKLYGVSITYVANYLRLNDLDGRVKELMHPDRGKNRQLGVSQAIEIAKVKDKELQFKIADETIDAHLTIRDTQYAIFQHASAAGESVYSYRGGASRKPSDDYKVLKSFLGRTENWLDRCGDRIEFAELYLYRDDPEQDLKLDLEQVKRIRDKFSKLGKMLDDFDKA